MKLDFNANIVLLISLVKCAIVFGKITSASHPLVTSLVKTANKARGPKATPIVPYSPSISLYDARRYFQNFASQYIRQKASDKAKKSSKKHPTAIKQRRRLGLPKKLRKTLRRGKPDIIFRGRRRRFRCMRCSIFGNRISKYGSRRFYPWTGYRRPFGLVFGRKVARKPAVSGIGKPHVGKGKNKKNKPFDKAIKHSEFHGHSDKSVISLKTKGTAKQWKKLHKATAKQAILAQQPLGAFSHIPSDMLRKVINKNLANPTHSISEQKPVIQKIRPVGRIHNMLNGPRVISSRFPTRIFGSNEVIMPPVNNGLSPHGNIRTMADKVNPKHDKFVNTRNGIGNLHVLGAQNALPFDVNTPAHAAGMLNILPDNIIPPSMNVADQMARLNNLRSGPFGFNEKSLPVNARPNNGQIDTRQPFVDPLSADKQTNLLELNNVLSMDNFPQANVDLIKSNSNNDIIKNPSIIPSLNIVGDILQGDIGATKGSENALAANSFDKTHVQHPSFQSHDSTVNDIAIEPDPFNASDGFIDITPDNTNKDLQHVPHKTEPVHFNDGVQSNLVNGVHKNLESNQHASIENKVDKIQTNAMQQAQDGFIDDVNVLSSSSVDAKIPNEIINVKQNIPSDSPIDKVIMDQGLNKLVVSGATIENTPIEMIPQEANLGITIPKELANNGDIVNDVFTELPVSGEIFAGDGFIDVIPDNTNIGSEIILDQSTTFNGADQIVDPVQHTNFVDEAVNVQMTDNLLKRPGHVINDNVGVHGQPSLSTEALPPNGQPTKKNMNIHLDGQIVPNEPLINDIALTNIDSPRIIVDSVVPSLVKNGNGILAVEPIGNIPDNFNGNFPGKGHTFDQSTNIQNHENTVDVISKDNEPVANSNDGFIDIISENNNAIKQSAHLNEHTNLNSNVNTNEVIKNDNHIHQSQHTDSVTEVKRLTNVDTSNEHIQHHVLAPNTQDVPTIHVPENNAQPKDVSPFGMFEKTPMQIEKNVGQVDISTDPAGHTEASIAPATDENLLHNQPSQNAFEANVGNDVPRADVPNIFKQNSAANGDMGVTIPPVTDVGISSPADIVRNLLDDAHSVEIIDLRNNNDVTRENIVDLLNVNSVNEHEASVVLPENHVSNEITQPGNNIVNEAKVSKHDHTHSALSSSHSENHSPTHQLTSIESIKPIVTGTHSSQLPDSHVGHELSHETGSQTMHSINELGAHVNTGTHSGAHDLHNTLTLHEQDLSHANEHTGFTSTSQSNTFANTDIHSSEIGPNTQTMINSGESITHVPDNNINNILLRFEDLIAGIEPHTPTNGGHSDSTSSAQMPSSHTVGSEVIGTDTAIKSVPIANNANNAQDASVEAGLVPRNVDDLFNLLSRSPSNKNILVSTDVLRMLVNAEMATTSDTPPMGNVHVNDISFGVNEVPVVVTDTSFGTPVDTTVQHGNNVGHAMDEATLNEMTDIGPVIPTTTNDKQSPNNVIVKPKIPRTIPGLMSSTIELADHAFGGEMSSGGETNLHTHHGIINGNEIITDDIAVLDVTMDKRHKEAHRQEGDRSNHEHLNVPINSPFGKDNQGKKKI